MSSPFESAWTRTVLIGAAAVLFPCCRGSECEVEREAIAGELTNSFGATSTEFSRLIERQFSLVVTWKRLTAEGKPESVSSGSLSVSKVGDPSVVRVKECFRLFEAQVSLRVRTTDGLFDDEWSTRVIMMSPGRVGGDAQLSTGDLRGTYVTMSGVSNGAPLALTFAFSWTESLGEGEFLLIKRATEGGRRLTSGETVARFSLVSPQP